jgi:signal transduction histidine kinase
MSANLTISGLPGVGDVAWGAHVCHFYRTRDDLLDSLVPYFKAGLEQNESCLWVTSEPFRATDARSALKNVVHDLDQRVAEGQIQIIDFDEWYTRGGKTDPDATIQGWIDRTQKALQAGYNGLRLTGNTYWLEHDQWSDFLDYERRVNETFRHHRILGLCSYCLGRCSQEEVFDVIRNHEFALVRRNGEWEHIESASLKLAKDELHRLAQQLEQRVAERTAELEAALRARDEFLSVASHELKTPVTSLQLYIETMLRASERRSLSLDEVPRRLEKAREQCHRLDKLITKLLDVSRATNGDMELNPEHLDLAALVRETAERMEPELARAGCTLQLQVPAALTGEWDRMRLEQVVTNLLTNVCRHAPGAPVEIALNRTGAYVQLAVSDNGPGISPDDQARIFRRFVQATEGRPHGGFGLGLWIVKQIAEAHGGTVNLVSSAGHGACFTISLPLVRH